MWSIVSGVAETAIVVLILAMQMIPFAFFWSDATCDNDMHDNNFIECRNTS